MCVCVPAAAGCGAWESVLNASTHTHTKKNDYPMLNPHIRGLSPARICGNGVPSAFSAPEIVGGLHALVTLSAVPPPRACACACVWVCTSNVGRPGRAIAHYTRDLPHITHKADGAWSACVSVCSGRFLSYRHCNLIYTNTRTRSPVCCTQTRTTHRRFYVPKNER